MDPIPRLTPQEWRLIAAVLPAGRATRRRHDDRAVVDALLYCEAACCALEAVPDQYQIGCRTLRTRRKRWRADGTWTKLTDRSGAAVLRMRREIRSGGEDLLTRLARLHGWDRL